MAASQTLTSSDIHWFDDPVDEMLAQHGSMPHSAPSALKLPPQHFVSIDKQEANQQAQALFLQQVYSQLQSGRTYSQLPMMEEKSCVLVALEQKAYDTARFIIEKMTHAIKPPLINREAWLGFSHWYRNSHMDEIIISLGADLRQTDSRKLEPIVYALVDNNVKLVEHILAHRTFSTSELNLYFHLACQRGAHHCLAALKAYGADIESLGVTGNTPLLSALEQGQDKTASILIALGAHVNTYSAQDVSALALCVSRGLKERAEELIEHGAQVNDLPYLGETALMAACRFGSIDMVEVLLRHGAQTHLLNQDHQTAGDIAQALGYKNIVGRLQRHEGRHHNMFYHMRHLKELFMDEFKMSKSIQHHG